MGDDPVLFQFRINGHLGPTLLTAFPALVSRQQGGETVLTGLLPDTAALYGVLAEIEALGQDLLEVRKVGLITGTRRQLFSCLKASLDPSRRPAKPPADAPQDSKQTGHWAVLRGAGDGALLSLFHCVSPGRIRWDYGSSVSI